MSRAFAEFDGVHLMDFFMRAQFPFKSPVSTNFTTRAAVPYKASLTAYATFPHLVLLSLMSRPEYVGVNARQL
jgi:hypothetical protein